MQVWDGLCWKVFEAVDSDIASVIEQGALNFFGKETDPTTLAKWSCGGIAGGGDFDQFDLVPEFGEVFGNIMCLPESQGAVSGANSKVHR